MLKKILGLLIVFIFIFPSLVFAWSSTNVKITWQPAVDPEGQLAGYRIYELDHNDIDDIAMHESNALVTLAPDLLEYTIINVPAGEHYYWISAFDQRGNEVLNPYGMAATVAEPSGEPPVWILPTDCKGPGNPHECCTAVGTGCAPQIEIILVD